MSLGKTFVLYLLEEDEEECKIGKHERKTRKLIFKTAGTLHSALTCNGISLGYAAKTNRISPLIHSTNTSLVLFPIYELPFAFCLLQFVFLTSRTRQIPVGTLFWRAIDHFDNGWQSVAIIRCQRTQTRKSKDPVKSKPSPPLTETFHIEMPY